MGRPKKVKVESKQVEGKKEFGLASLQHGMAVKAKEFLSSIQQEMVQEEQEAFKDFIKGAYRYSVEKEKEIENLKKEVATIKDAIDLAANGNWSSLSTIRIPARFFEESTLRRHGKTLMSGNAEIRFMDLYVDEDK